MSSGGLGRLSIPSLVELRISMQNAELSWLSDFANRHPSLRKIMFLGENTGMKLASAPHTPFIDRFFEAAATDTLAHAAAPAEFGIEREACWLSTPGSFFDGWAVTALALHIKSSIIHVMRLASRVFPSVEFLTLTMETSDAVHIVCFITICAFN